MWANATAMDTVRLQCHICCSVGEIKNYYLRPVDVITILPIVELHLCKHQICVTCVRKIAQRNKDKRIECPMCRRKNLHFNVYSVNRNVVDTFRCPVAEVREHGRFNGLIDAASLARGLFEKSLSDADAAPENPAKPIELQTTLARLQGQIDEQTKLNYDLQLKTAALMRANEEVGNRLNKSRDDCKEINKQIELLRSDKLQEERSLKALAHKHIQWLDKNNKLQRQNEQLTKENIKMIRDNNLFKQKKTHKRKADCN